MAKLKDSEILANFLGAQNALIINGNPGTKRVIRQVLMEMGIKAPNVKVADTYKDGLEMLDKGKPQIVSAEYEIEGKPGLDLLTQMRGYCPSSIDGTFILVSEKNSPSIAAQAAEEEVDAFLTQPFTVTSIKNELTRVFQSKLQVTDYLKTLEKGKTFLKASQFKEAQEVFNAAKKLDSAPAAAWYYEGLIHKKQNEFEKAEACFQDGLKTNPKHFKCLSGLYEVLFEQKKYEPAYQAVKTLNVTHPISPKRLPELIRLYILCRRYTEIEEFYNLFTKTEDRDPVVISYVAAGLVICGKFLLQQGNKPKAVDMLNKAGLVANKHLKILMEVIRSLLTAGFQSEASALIAKLPEEASKSSDLQMLLLEQSNISDPIPNVIKNCQELLAKGVKESRIFEIMITRSIEFKRKRPVIEQLVSDATAAFPDKRQFFEDFLKKVEG